MKQISCYADGYLKGHIQNENDARQPACLAFIYDQSEDAKRQGQLVSSTDDDLDSDKERIFITKKRKFTCVGENSLQESGCVIPYDLSTEEYQNEISYNRDDIQYAMPISMQDPLTGVIINLNTNTPNLGFPAFVGLPSCRGYFIMEGLSEQSNNFGLEVSATADSICCTEVDLKHEQDYSWISSDKKESINNSLKMVDNLVCIEDIADDHQEQMMLSWNVDDVKINGLIEQDMDDELFKSEEKENKTSCLKKNSDNAADTLSPEPCQPIGKVISPCSQERQLHLAKDSAEICKDVEQYEAANYQGLQHESRGVRRGNAKRKPLKAKGNREVAHLSRTRFKINTDCTSTIQGCSEGAIAFSQKQMRDIKTIVVTLINEMKSITDFVKEASISDVNSSRELRKNLDMVKSVQSAVTHATTVEEKAQKRLSQMSIDCDRFCQIMELMPKGFISTEEIVIKEKKKKKIKFADETGVPTLS